MNDVQSDEIINDYEPNIHDIDRYYDNFIYRGKFDPVKGNQNTRVTVALLFPLKGTSVVLKGASGSGKSMIIKCTSQLAWGDKIFDDKVREVLYVGGSSDKGLITDSLANRIAYICTHCIIPELQNAIQNERMEAIVKLWAEGESYPYKRGDNFGKITKELTLRPLPLMTSIATENKHTERLGEEIERRFFPFYTISNTSLNEEIHKSKAESRARCDEELIKMTDIQKTDLRYHLQNAMKKPYKIKNPMAPYMQKAIPHNFVVSNSMIGYWFDLVEAVTLFHYPKRNSFTTPGGMNTYLLSTPGDNYLAWKLGGEPIVLASMNIPDMGREIISILPKRDELTPEISIDLNDIVDELHRKGIERTKRQVQQIMKALESVSYAKRDEYHKEQYYKTQDYEFEQSVNWQKGIDNTKEFVKENYNGVSKDYIRDFCEDPVVIDPFTGDTIKLLDIEYNGKAEEKIVKRRKASINIGDYT